MTEFEEKVCQLLWGILYALLFIATVLLISGCATANPTHPVGAIKRMYKCKTGILIQRCDIFSEPEIEVCDVRVPADCVLYHNIVY